MLSIYANAKTSLDAEILFDEWIRDAKCWNVPELRNSATERSNRKTRGLLEMTCGFLDYRFLRLRIYNLGEKKSIKARRTEACLASYNTAGRGAHSVAGYPKTPLLY